ncbi:MAG: HYR domain-containing protein, partial [Verrucomicrobia bacterium]
LNGLFYFNIHTATYPGGEMRAQVIAVSTNLPPSLTCPAPAVAECASAATLTATVIDAEGDAMTVAWSLNGVVVQTNSIAAGAAGATNNVSLTAVFPLGTNSIGITVTDAAGNTASCDSTITVVDTTPPVIVSTGASPNSLWPPNHKMIPVQISAVVTDACTTATWKIASVTSNQAVNGKGDGNTSPDWQIVDNDTVKLRAERAGNDGSRVYTITIHATDEAGNQSSATVTVTVPHDQSGKAKPAPPAKGKTTSRKR